MCTEGGLGVGSLWTDYLQSNIRALTHNLNDTGRLGTVTRALMNLQGKTVGDMAAALHPRYLRLHTTLRQLAMVTQNDMVLMDKGTELTMQPNGLWTQMQLARAKEISNPTLQAKLNPGILLPFSESGVYNMAHITNSEGTHIITASEMQRQYSTTSAPITSAMKKDFNRVTLIITGHELTDDPKHYKYSGDLTKDKRYLPTTTDSPSKRKKQDISTFWQGAPEMTRTQEEREEERESSPVTQLMQRKRNMVSKDTRPNGRRKSMQQLTDRESATYQALLAKGNMQAMETEYSEQNMVTHILHKQTLGTCTYTRPTKKSKKDVNLTQPQPTQVQFMVQWADTIMLNQHVQKHLESYKTIGYIAANTTPEGDNHTRVSWEPRTEPRSTLEALPHWDQLLQEYEEEKAEIGRKELGRPPARLDDHLSNLQQQGIWEGMQQTRDANLLQYISFSGTETNPDRDIIPGEGPSMQRGTWDAATKESMDDGRIYVYRSTGQCAGVLTEDARRDLQKSYKGTNFVGDLISLMQRYKHKQGHMKATATAHTLLPKTFTRALKHLGISTERNSSPLTRRMPTYWSTQADDTMFSSNGLTYSTKWEGASLFQLPHKYNAETTKAIRWALASAQATNKPTLTMLTFPDAPGAYYTQLTQHPCVLDMGTVHHNVMTKEQHWTYLAGEQETNTNPKQKTRVLLVANAEGQHLHLQMQQWQAFSEEIQQANPHTMKMPKKTAIVDLTSNAYKPPKAFTGLKPATNTPTTSTMRAIPSHVMTGVSRAPLYRDHTSQIYTDGSCIKQGAANSIGAAYSIKTGKEATRVTHVNPGGRGATNTNNRAELSAIHMALLDPTISMEDVTLYTDSLWSLQVLHKALHNPQVMRLARHRELLEAILEIVTKRARSGLHTRIRKVKAHVGIQGNEEVDQAAKEVAMDKLKVGDVLVVDPTTDQAYSKVTWPHAIKKDGEEGRSLWALDNLTSKLKEHLLPKWHVGQSKVGLYATLNKEELPKMCKDESAAMWASPAVTFKNCIHVLRAQHGQVWNRRKAFARGAPYNGQKCTTPKCPLCPLTDGTAHILGECTHPQMVAHRISRHNQAVLILMKALQKGILGGFVTIMDATAKASLPESCMDTRVPAWVLPKVPETDRLKLRPDLMVFEGLTPAMQEGFQQLKGPRRIAAMKKLKVHIYEVGYTSNTRTDELFEEKRQQHASLIKALTEEGWTVNYPKENIIVLGTAAWVRLETKQLLQKWLPQDSATVTATLKKLSVHSAKKCMDHIITRRILEKGCQPGTEGWKAKRRT
jgi:ribonuclease HI